MGSIIMSVVVVAIGIALGLARGGQVRSLLAFRPQWWGLLAGGFVLQAFAETFDIVGATSMAVIGMFVLIVGLMANPWMRGALIAAFGISLNLLVLVINGAVPIRFEALSPAGLIDTTTQRSDVASVGHLLELETADTTLGSLGDTIPIGWLNSVISIGDLVTFAGVIVILSNLVAARRTVGVDVDAVFGPAPIRMELQHPNEPVPGVLDLASDDPVIDVSSPRPITAPAITQPTGAEPIDLTFDPDDLWADDDTGVRILGPSSKSS